MLRTVLSTQRIMVCVLRTVGYATQRKLPLLWTHIGKLSNYPKLSRFEADLKVVARLSLGQREKGPVYQKH